MHGLGRVLRLERQRDGKKECLAYAGHWNPYAEQLFAYEQPVALEPGDRLTLSCTYSTVNKDGDVNQGGEIDDEECQTLLFVTSSR
jgi:hypothetical protein